MGHGRDGRDARNGRDKAILTPANMEPDERTDSGNADEAKGKCKVLTIPIAEPQGILYKKCEGKLYGAERNEHGSPENWFEFKHCPT